MTQSDFLTYCLSFYGRGGVYDLGATREELAAALKARLEGEGIPFEGDSTDRELVRDLLIEKRQEFIGRRRDLLSKALPC